MAEQVEDLYFVSWEDNDLHWMSEQFTTHAEAEGYAEYLVRNGLAHEVEIR